MKASTPMQFAESVRVAHRQSLRQSRLATPPRRRPPGIRAAVDRHSSHRLPTLEHEHDLLELRVIVHLNAFAIQVPRSTGTMRAAGARIMCR